VRNLFIVAGLEMVSLIAVLLGAWPRQSLFAALGLSLISVEICCGIMGFWMLYDSKIGKIREREVYLDKIPWRGDERVLDVGCGLGLFLIGAGVDSRRGVFRLASPR